MIKTKKILLISFFSLFLFAIGTILNNSKAATTTVNLTITSGNIIIGTPGECDLGTFESSSETGYISGQCRIGEYFYVNDLVGNDSGYRTTIQITNLNGSLGDSISGDLIELKRGSTTPTKLAGQTNENVIISSTLSGYYPIGESINYIMRNQGTNNGLVGKYGDSPRIKITIPPYSAGSYSGTIIFTLMEPGL
ncbi:MAG: hypothetical protein WC872_02135 [Candidatus Absconditabacterales bacterium]